MGKKFNPEKFIENLRATADALDKKKNEHSTFGAHLFEIQATTFRKIAEDVELAMEGKE